MTPQSIAVGILLGLAVFVAIVAATGMMLMRDTLQRLHFSALTVSLSVGLIAIAVWIEPSDAQARIKVVLVAGLLFGMNSILTHATARAVRIRQAGHWDVWPVENIPIGQHAATDKNCPPQESQT